MASTGGGAARSSKKKSPDVADQEETSSTELVGTAGTVGTVDVNAIDRKLDTLVTTIAALADSVNKLINADVKDEKVAEPSKKLSVDRSGKKKRNDVKLHEEFIPDVGEIVKLAFFCARIC